MRIIALQSGSKGNCIYLESAQSKILIDAGLSGSGAQQRLADHNINIRDVNALFISHDHADHIACAGIFNRKFNIPLWTTPKTFEAIENRIGEVNNVWHFESNTRFRFQDLTIEAVRTPHDAVDGVCFVIDDGRARFGICTDLGHVFSGLPDLILSLDGVLLESNFDPRMLQYGLYPEPLKRRIQGLNGHLSNEESARLIQSSGRRLKSVMLGHISENNNTESVVLDTHKKILGPDFNCEIAHYRTSSNTVLL